MLQYSLQQDTLAFQFGVRPGVVGIDNSFARVPEVVDRLKAFSEADTIQAYAGLAVEEPPRGHPERDAVVFYLLNHATSLVKSRVRQHEPLGKYLPLVETYHTQLAARAARMFFYLLLICTRESRHERTDFSSTLWASLQQKYGAGATWARGLRGLSSHDAANRIQTNPPKVNLGGYTKLMVDIFYKGKFGGGYGGPAWGAVADVLNGYVHGSLSAELMMDTAFTLCHNNGPIFNKGMLFDSYSNEIYKILDVQRSGQIPQLVANNETKWATDKTVSELWAQCHQLLGEDFSGYVDWYRVEELGSMHKYHSEKNAQTKKHGIPASHIKAELAKQKHLDETLAKKKAMDAAAKAKAPVQIMPGVSVVKEERHG